VEELGIEILHENFPLFSYTNIVSALEIAREF
jgi:hypothetical protein